MKEGIKFFDSLQRQRKNSYFANYIGKSSRNLGKSEKSSLEKTKANYNQTKKTKTSYNFSISEILS